MLVAAKQGTSPRATAAQRPHDDFHDAVVRAARLSTLAEPGARPFHLKITAQDISYLHSPDYNADIEIWWAKPDKWRREVRSPVFTQQAIQNDLRYYESNRPGEYLPYWLDELIRASTNPVPVDFFADVSPDEDRPGCGNWEVPHGSGDQRVSSYAMTCFDRDGTVQQILAAPIGIIFGAYRAFGDKRIARRLEVWANRSDIIATVTTLESLRTRHSDDERTPSGLFDPPAETGFASRVRFVSVPESELVPTHAPRPPLTWPSTYTFPVDGVIAIRVKIDRDGSIRESDSGISRNQAINGGVVAQVKNWKFKPYLEDGAPVQVATTLEIPFHLKYEPLGANGKEFPPVSFGEHMRQYRAVSDLRDEGSKPFQLRASFELARGGTGKYEEIWQSSAEWARRVELGGVVLRETRSGGKTTTEFDGDTGRQVEMRAVMTAIQDRLPDLRAFQEADWGNSAVPANNVYPQQSADSSEPMLIRAARGAVNANNHPTSGQAYWFDSDGLLRASFADNMTVVNSSFALWDRKQVPRRIELFFGSLPAAVITVSSIEATQIQDRSAM